jgi:acyl-coenzyme A synthetase/AMP-(fatty) acid ligase
VQPHRSYVNTAQCYARHVLCYGEDDVTLSVPKLYFGYAMGSNLLFPFAAGASGVLFDERCTADAIFSRIARYRPTVLITVPTMVNQMVSHPEAGHQDLSCLRLATSAGEGLPEELHARWDRTFGVPLLDGLGTAEQWHIFLSNRVGRVRRGTLGEVVPGFEIKVMDEEGREVPDGTMGHLWVRGGSRALGYWQQLDKSQTCFRGEWVVTGDLVKRDPDGYYTYGGRADELLKVSGKWLSATEVEGCLLQHPAVSQVAVVGVADANGLVKPHAWVIPRERRDGLAEELKAFVCERLEQYKCPREVIFVDSLPTTHLGKVDRGKLRATK